MSVSKVSKVGCIFPVVIWPEDRMEQYRDDDHLEDAPHFTKIIKPYNLLLRHLRFREDLLLIAIR